MRADFLSASWAARATWRIGNLPYGLLADVAKLSRFRRAAAGGFGLTAPAESLRVRGMVRADFNT
jgi:hypothetical protein